MAAELLSQRMYFHLYFWYCWSSWWHNLKRQCSLFTITSYQVDYVIYADGSNNGGTRNGGAAAVITRGSPLQSDVITTIKTEERTFASSYEEEAAAMESALSWTLTNTNHCLVIVHFCTGSKSFCETLISSHLRAFSIHNSINSKSSSIFIQWIPGYSGIPGNDLANKAAKEATTIATDTILPISLSSSIQVINETIRDSPLKHEWVASVYKHWRVAPEAVQINNGKDDVLIACLWSNHHPFLKQYLHRFEPSQDPTCPNFPPRRRSPSLALRLSGFDNRETTSVWVPSRVLRVACHSTWGCSGIHKEDPGQPWCLTQ